MKHLDKNQVCQGDVLLVAVDSVPDGEAEENTGRAVLAHGEATGHAHAIYDRSAQVVRTAKKERHLKLLAPSPLKHEEHSAPLQSAKLWCKPRQGDTSVVMIECLNSTPETDGSIKHYMIRVQPDAYNGEASKNCHAAMASTYRNEADGSLYSHISRVK